MTGRAAALALLLCTAGAAPAAAAPCAPGPLFDQLPMPLSEFRAFRPLGFLSFPIHVVPAWHSSFSRTLPGETRPRVEVRFPGEATLVSVFAVEFLSNGSKGYQLRFAPCDQALAYFNHLATVGARIDAALGATPGDCTEYFDGSGMVRNCRHAVSLRVGSGEPAGLSDDTSGVDFGMIDYRLPAAGFANPAHYTRDFFYYASPVGYFVPELREALEARLGSYDGSVPRTAEPRGGAHMQDLPGTAQGTWFTPGISFVGSTSEDTMIALAHDYVDPRQPIFSIGARVAGLRAGLAAFVPEPAGRVNRDFAEVRADGETYCYDRFTSGRSVGGVPLGDPGGVLLLSMPTPTTLRIERRGAPGDSCAGVPDWALSGAASNFER